MVAPVWGGGEVGRIKFLAGIIKRDAHNAPSPDVRRGLTRTFRQASMMDPGSEADEAPRPALSPHVSALLALPLNACRWPVPGPRWWCGEPATCGSYCVEHYRNSRAEFERRR
jgi:hypothetical protein